MYAVDLADMEGDGVLDIVTGKRYWAHGPHGDPEPNAKPVLYYFETVRDGSKASGSAKFEAVLIDDNSGVGTEVIARDINGDKKADVVVGNKKGTMVFVS
jgi:hypothetical protein